MVTFNDDTESLSQPQTKSFELCYALQRGDRRQMEDRSRQSRSVRHRASEPLRHIYRFIKHELFLSCTLVSVTATGKRALRFNYSTLQKWSNPSLRPQSLTRVATQLCNVNKTDSLMAEG
jgi:hypothetical protein